MDEKAYFVETPSASYDWYWATIIFNTNVSWKTLRWLQVTGNRGQVLVFFVDWSSLFCFHISGQNWTFPTKWYKLCSHRPGIKYLKKQSWVRIDSINLMHWRHSRHLETRMAVLFSVHQKCHRHSAFYNTKVDKILRWLKKKGIFKNNQKSLWEMQKKYIPILTSGFNL